MKLLRWGALALAVPVIVSAAAPLASAQRTNGNMLQRRSAMPAQAQPLRVAAHQEQQPAAKHGAAGKAAAPVHIHEYEMGSVGYPGDSFYEDAYCGNGMCEVPCQEPGFGGGLCPPGQFFFTADYLYVRASFSQADAYMVQDLSQQNLVARDLRQLDFDYESSYRFGGGYRLCGCGNEIRFLYTRLDSEASDAVDFSTDVFIPYEPGTPPGGRTVIDADVSIDSYDLECAKTIPLGQLCCDCGDVCGGCCPPPCPVWDITWSGGIRVADADWQRSYVGLDAADAFVGEGLVRMDFEGVGGKVGLEGRRYFGRSGWFSVFAKGDISLLVGDLDLNIVRTIDGGSVPDNVITQSFSSRQMIPVTEIEAGVTGQITRSARISGGYLLSAWHDLGFRDEFELAGQNTFPVSYDDANILAFDGFFARIEVAY